MQLEKIEAPPRPVLQPQDNDKMTEITNFYLDEGVARATVKGKRKDLQVLAVSTNTIFAFIHTESDAIGFVLDAGVPGCPGTTSSTCPCSCMSRNSKIYASGFRPTFSPFRWRYLPHHFRSVVFHVKSEWALWV